MRNNVKEMKTREKTIPKQGSGELRIPEALDRLIKLYTAMDKPDEVKKWREERAMYPEAKNAPAPAKRWPCLAGAPGPESVGHFACLASCETGGGCFGARHRVEFVMRCSVRRPHRPKYGR